MVAELRSEEYYVKMMAAWYFATALAKQYTAVLPFLEEQNMDVPEEKSSRLDEFTKGKAGGRTLEDGQ